MFAGSLRGSLEFNNLLDEEQDNDVIVEEEEKREEVVEERQEANLALRSPIQQLLPTTSVMTTPHT